VKEALYNKIQQLSAEAHQLSNLKFNLQAQLKDIDTRLIQLTGALSELKKLESEIGEIDGQGEDATNNQPGVHDNVPQTNGDDCADEDSVQTEEVSGSDNGRTEEV
jgi:predicted  nucleic acid-binding Zn-ribbon protein